MSTQAEPEPTNALVPQPAPAPGEEIESFEDAGDGGTLSISPFASRNSYLAAKQMAVALSNSTIVPAAYQGKPANCLVAMELAGRTGAGVMMVMQNLHIIQGRPSWSAAFLIGSVNSCGRFSPIRFEIVGEDPSKADYRVRAFAIERASGDRLDGEWITWPMAIAEGWKDKAGSKWKTMPGQMFRYRAASFWTRTYAPEISLGMLTQEEAEDIPPVRGAQSTPTTELNRALLGTKAETKVAETDEDIRAEAQATLDREKK
jgi:hypothetical protein